MAGTAPDATSLLTLTGAAATDAALRTLLGSATGKLLRVGPEHWLHKSAADVASVTLRRTATEADLSWAAVDWMLGRVINITALSGIKCNWMFRPAFMSQVLMDLQTGGGLQALAAAHEGELAAALSSAARVLPVIKATPADVIILDSLSTGGWLDEATTANFTSHDGSARAYVQMRTALG